MIVIRIDTSALARMAARAPAGRQAITRELEVQADEQVRDAQSGWPVDSGESRDGVRRDRTAVVNDVRHSPYVMVGGRPAWRALISEPMRANLRTRCVRLARAWTGALRG